MTPFPALIDKLQRRVDLSVDEAAGAMEAIMDGQAQPSQIAGFLVGLAKKVLIADQCARVADAIFAVSADEVPMVTAWLGAVAYALHFGTREPRTGRAATGILAGGVLSHTFLIGMQTVQAGHAPLVGTSAAISAFVWLLGLSYLYIELTSDERAMGMFVADMVPDNPGKWLFHCHVSAHLRMGMQAFYIVEP